MPLYKISKYCCDELAENSYGLWINGSGDFSIDDSEGYFIMRDIKYCPYCGKELSELELIQR